MKNFLLATSLLLSLCVSAADTSWTAPVTISKPGDYYNLYAKSIDGTPAISIWAEKVRLFNCAAWSTEGGNAYDVDGYRQPEFYNCIAKASYGASNLQPGRGWFVYKPRKLIIKHCAVYNMNGIIIQQEDETGLMDSIIVAYNAFYNITKAKPDGSTGSTHCHSIQLNAVHNSGPVEIYGNRSIGLAGSANEDIINVNESYSKPGTYINIYGNLISGALVYPISSKDGYTGSGFTIETASKRVRFKKNVVLDCMNALANISEPGPESSDNQITDNYLVSAGIPRGAESLRPGQYWSGLSDYMYSADSGRNNIITRNYVAFVSNRSLSHFYPFDGRHDENNVNNAGVRIPSQNRMLPGYNYYLPYKPTKATEDSAIKRWDDSLAKIGQYVGITAPMASNSIGSITLNQFDSVLVSATPLDTAKLPARYAAGSFRYISSDSSILAVQQSSIETQAKLVGRKAGRVSVTGSLTTERGNPVQKTFSVEVLYLYPEPVDISFTFSKPGQ